MCLMHEYITVRWEWGVKWPNNQKPKRKNILTIKKERKKETSFGNKNQSANNLLCSSNHMLWQRPQNPLHHGQMLQVVMCLKKCFTLEGYFSQIRTQRKYNSYSRKREGWIWADPTVQSSTSMQPMLQISQG